jgi:mono/diheme cytochrome c family protein
MRSLTKGIILGVGGTVLLAILIWLGVVFSGAYNVAATDKHFDVVRWTFHTTMHRSVATRADEISLPERISEDLIAEGARHYDSTCIYCHGAPGQEPSEWSRGMRPEPPQLVEAAAHWSPEEIFWIVQNGFKMTGMPAFGSHHDSSEIAAIAAFVSQLPDMPVEDYRALTAETR